ncbi:MAG: hypothetical protein ACOY0T_10865 [Myxococcota bacterium]
MSDRRDLREATARVLDPDDVEGVLSSAFYTKSEAREPKPVAQAEDKPQHYKVICISMYTEDLKRLDHMVDALKTRGLTKANRSALIRYALAAVDLDRVPKGL